MAINLVLRSEEDAVLLITQAHLEWQHQVDISLETIHLVWIG